LLFIPPLAGAFVFAQEGDRAQIVQEPAARNSTVYDGNWWLNSAVLTRAGFLDGLRDYFVSHGEKWPVGQTEYGVMKITEHYSRTAGNRSSLVPVVWKRVLMLSPPPKSPPGSPLWDSPHG